MSAVGSRQSVPAPGSGAGDPTYAVWLVGTVGSIARRALRNVK